MPGSLSVKFCTLETGEGGPLMNDRMTEITSSILRSHLEAVGERPVECKRVDLTTTGILGTKAFAIRYATGPSTIFLTPFVLDTMDVSQGSSRRHRRGAVPDRIANSGLGLVVGGRTLILWKLMHVSRLEHPLWVGWFEQVQGTVIAVFRCPSYIMLSVYT